MKKHITIATFIAAMAVLYTGCNEDNNNTSATTMRTSQFAGSQGTCTNGGVKVEVLVDGTVDETQTQYLCNGANGQNGQNGQGGQSGSNTTLRTTPFTDAQGGCANGGIKFEVLVDGVVDNTQTQYICNGQNGQGGQSGSNTTMRTTPFTDAQGGCANGGIKFEVLVDGVVDDTQTQYICNGTQGGQGQSGTNTTMRTTPFDGAQGSCTNGGVKIEVLVNGVVDNTQTQYICNGQKGEQGEQGEAGCSNGEKSCGGVCTDITTNIANCGACGHDCNASKPTNAGTMGCVDSQCIVIDCADGYIPQDGQCVSCSSVAGWAKCGGKCVETDSDNDNCGTCGNKCTNGLICASGNCVGNTTCSAGNVDTATSIDHCGKCNNRCDDGKTCIDGKCKIGYGKAYCGTVKVQIGDIDRCGGCDDKCADGKICKDNKCANGAGPTYCDNISTNTLNDASNCGSCGHRCEDSNCVNGECVDSQGGYASDEMYCNGILVHSLSDSAHCNGCGNHCAVGFQCMAGTCQPYDLTYSSTITCDGHINVKPYSDSNNCGKCGNVCGKCDAGRCNLDCDGKNLNNDFFNCGQCAYTCATNQSCNNGTCGTYSVGGTVAFGYYNGSPIQWYILDNDTTNHRIMLLSMDILEIRPYNTKYTGITWERSTIRSWLNGYAPSYNSDGNDYTGNNFINTAFSASEKTRIVPSIVPAHANPSYSTSPGNTTTDKIFLLSITEVQNLLGTGSDMCTKIHCINSWWLRSPGLGTSDAAYVFTDGSVSSRGDYVNRVSYGVRPALWLKY